MRKRLISCKRQLRSLRKRLADRNITLDLTPAALELLAREGFDPIYGARSRIVGRKRER